MGLMYQYGEGVTAAQDTARKWYSMSAEQGYALSKYALNHYQKMREKKVADARFEALKYVDRRRRYYTPDPRIQTIDTGYRFVTQTRYANGKSFKVMTYKKMYKRRVIR